MSVENLTRFYQVGEMTANLLIEATKSESVPASHFHYGIRGRNRVPTLLMRGLIEWDRSDPNVKDRVRVTQLTRNLLAE